MLDTGMGPYGDDLPLLLGYQKAWIEEDADVAVCVKSRRIGLSWADASEEVVYAGEGKGNVYYMSYDKDMTRGYIDDCTEWAKRLNQAVSEVVEETITEDERQHQVFVLRCDSGKAITALSSLPRVLRSKGRPGDKIIIDEAAFCENLIEVLKAAMAFTQWGGKVRIVSTHNGADSPFNELVEDVLAKRRPYALHHITLDDAIAGGLARRICTVKGDDYGPDYDARWRAEQIAKYRDSEEADEELFCIPRQGGGAWLSRALIESRMFDAPVLRFTGSAEFNGWPEPTRRAEMKDWLDEHLAPLLAKLDPLRRHVFGMDFARSGDLSVYLPFEIGETLLRRSPFVLELKNVPHMQQLQAIEYVTDRLPRFSGAAMDARGNGSFVAEATADKYGSSIDPVMATEAWYRENMPPYKAAFEDALILLPRSDDVVNDHRAIKLVRGVPRLPEGKTDKAGERHGDSAMAGALAWYASVNDGGPIEFESAGARESAGAFDTWLGNSAPRGRGMFAGYV